VLFVSLQRPRRSLLRRSAPQSDDDFLQHLCIGGHHWRFARNSVDLQSLLDMFPMLDRDTVFSAFSSFDRNMNETVEYLLCCEHVQEPAPALTADSSSVSPCCPPTSNSHDFLRRLPSDAFLLVMDSLSFLDMCSVGLTSHAMHAAVLEKTKDIKSVDLYAYRNLRDREILSMLSLFPHLDSLSLRGCRKFSLFHALGSCAPSVKRLNLASCIKLDDHAIQYLLAFMPGLTLLDLSNTHIMDSALDSLAEHSFLLGTLLLEGCLNITDFGVTSVLQRSEKLESLSLKDTSVTIECLRSRAPAFSLKNLSLQSCAGIIALDLCSRPFVHLRNLNFSCMPRLVRATIALPSLSSLNLRNCSSLHTLTLRTPLLSTLLLNGCFNLVSLTTEGTTPLMKVDLTRCRRLSPSTLISFLVSCQGTLQSLCTVGCFGMDDSVVQFVLNHFTKLTVFDLSGCKSVHSDLYIAVQNQMRSRAAAISTPPTSVSQTADASDWLWPSLSPLNPSVPSSAVSTSRDVSSLEDDIKE